MKNICSVSFGKDSLAMVLKMIENEINIDEVIFYDTGMEFQAVYDIKNRMLPIFEANNIVFTELKPKCDFMYKMFEKPVNGKNGLHYGYSWCGGKCRWETRNKIRSINKYLRSKHEEINLYVGLAADETKRLEREKNSHKVFPLVAMGLTEKDCLNICYEHGFFWEEYDGDKVVRLYDILDRVSCWCCRNKNLKELENIYLHLPKYWEGLKYIQSRTSLPMKGEGKSVFDLEERFKKNIKLELDKK